MDDFDKFQANFQSYWTRNESFRKKSGQTFDDFWVYNLWILWVGSCWGMLLIRMSPIMAYTVNNHDTHFFSVNRLIIAVLSKIFNKTPNISTRQIIMKVYTVHSLLWSHIITYWNKSTRYVYDKTPKYLNRADFYESVFCSFFIACSNT